MIKNILWIIVAPFIVLVAVLAGASLVLADHGPGNGDEEATGHVVIEYNLPFDGVLPNSGSEDMHLEWTRLDITVHNPGQAKQGELILKGASSYEPESELLLRVPLELGEHDTLHIPVKLPVEEMIHLDIGFVNDEGTLLAEESLQAQVDYIDTAAIGIVSEDQSFRPGGLGKGERAHIDRMDLYFIEGYDMIPEEGWLIPFDILVLDPQAPQRLNGEQIDALQEWVNNGGVLILSYSEALEAKQEQFSQLLPHTLSATETVDLTDFEQQFESGSETQTDDTGADGEEVFAELATGSSKQNVQHFPRPDRPLFSGRAVGRGFVVLNAVDLTEGEEARRWMEAYDVWSRMYDVFQLESIVDRVYEEQVIELISKWGSEFPGFEPPSVRQAALIWIVYVIVCGPLLYLILKKKDKREWAWGIIPTIVIITTLVIYMLGMQRLSADFVSHTVSHIHLSDTAEAEVQQEVNFFIPDGQDTSIALEEEEWAMSGGNNNNYISVSGDRPVLRYEGIPYRSIIQAGAFRESQLGYVQDELYVDDDRLLGTLTNDTTMDLQDVALYIGGRQYELGTLNSGEEKEVDIWLDTLLVPGLSDDVEQDIVWHGDEPYDEMMYSERDLWERTYHRTYDDAAYHGYDPGEVYSVGHPQHIWLMARSTDPVDTLDMLDKDEQRHFTSVITQKVDIKPHPQTGLVRYPPGVWPVIVTDSEGDVSDDRTGVSLANGGEVWMTLAAGSADVDVKRVRVPLEHESFSPFQVYVWQEEDESWQELPAGEPLDLDESELARYTGGTGQIKLRFRHDGSQYKMLPYPFYEVEGGSRS